MGGKRVLVIGPQNAGQLPASLATAFEQRGFDVVRFDSDAAYFNAGWPARHRLTRRVLRSIIWTAMNEQTLEVIRLSRPHLVFAVKGTYLDPSTVRHIRTQLGIPIANYYSDNPYCGRPWNPRKSSVQRADLVEALREYSKVWIWDREMARRLESDGVDSSYLPFGVDPAISRGDPDAACMQCRERHPVVFIGQHSDKREAHVATVRRHTVALWGSRWARRAGAMKNPHVIHAVAAFGTQCANVYAAAAVSLNIVDDLNMPGHNMRTFEIPASGGLMLSTYTPEQAELFPEGEAALYYHDPSEIDQQLDLVLTDPARASRMRARARTIATAHHYTQRVKSMTTELGV